MFNLFSRRTGVSNVAILHPREVLNYVFGRVKAQGVRKSRIWIDRSGFENGMVGNTRNLCRCDSVDLDKKEQTAQRSRGVSDGSLLIFFGPER